MSDKFEITVSLAEANLDRACDRAWEEAKEEFVPRFDYALESRLVVDFVRFRRCGDECFYLFTAWVVEGLGNDLWEGVER